MQKKHSEPVVSVLIPALNEERFIARCLDSLIDDFVAENAEVLVMDGGSSDGTKGVVARYIKEHEDVDIRLLDNPKKHQSYGLNIGIDEAEGKVIVRVDAHAEYPKGYVKECVDLLESTGADNVGGVMNAVGRSKFQKLIALAMKNPVGVGDARFHLGNYKGFVDTVYLGTFRRNLFGKLGYFDPYTNQDAEFNLRILKSGGRVYLDSSIKVNYFPRESFRGLIKQYFNYGRGRCRTTLKHRKFTSFRQLAPIALVLGLIGSFILSLLISPFFLLLPLVYPVSLLGASFWTLRKFAPEDAVLLAFIFASMHISWGLGFLSYFFGISR